MLRANGFSIDLPFWPRATAITAASFYNSATGLFETVRYGRRLKNIEVESPLFVLGVWRSGTTHLQNLLCKDHRFGYANYFQVVFPNSFLCTEAYTRKILQLCMPNSRLQDNVFVSPTEPAEDEVATSIMTQRSMLMSWMFFRNQSFYDRFLTFEDATEDEIANWQAALLLFLKKLTLKYQRPLVLKSPGHTGRIRLLLEMFPDAKFVNIVRNPYDVYQSSEHTFRTVASMTALQRPDLKNIEDRNIRQYAELCDAYIKERSLIPKGNLHEVRFEDLEKAPLNEMEKIYQALDLPDFEEIREELSEYIEGLQGYQRNRFQELPEKLRARIAREWRRSFEEWGYDV